MIVFCGFLILVLYVKVIEWFFLDLYGNIRNIFGFFVLVKIIKGICIDKRKNEMKKKINIE